MVPKKNYRYTCPKAIEVISGGVRAKGHLASYYLNRYRTLEFKSYNWEKKAQIVARDIAKYKSRYKAVEQSTGVPWYVIGVIHSLESGRNWSRNLHNGEKWDKKTTLVPKGRGPFSSWEEAAIDALMLKKVNFPKEWTIGAILRFLEIFNGWGYFNRQLPSPYIWSGTNHYERGKYIADGKFSATAVSKQLGCATIICAGEELQLWDTNENEIVNSLVNVEMICYSTRKPISFILAELHQIFLNDLIGIRLLNIPCLKVDGILGKKTSAMHKMFYGIYLLGDPRAQDVAARDLAA